MFPNAKSVKGLHWRATGSVHENRNKPPLSTGLIRYST